MSKSNYAYIGLAMMALVIYAVGVFSRSIWYDESITLYTLSKGAYVSPLGLVSIAELQNMLSSLQSPAGVVGTLISDDVHPPLYFVLLNLWSYIFGSSLEAARAFSVLLSLLSVGVFYALISEHRPKYALGYTLVFALSGLMVGVAAEARSTALVILLTLVAFYVANRRKPGEDLTTDLRTELILGLVSAGLLLTHYFAALIVAPIMMHRGLIFLQQRNWRYLIAPLVCFLIFLPWFGVFIAHLGARPDQGVGFGGILAWGKTALLRLSGVVVSPSHFGYPSLIALAGQAGVLAAAGLGGWFSLRGLLKAPASWRLESFALFTAALAMLMLTALFMVTDKMMSPLRYFAICLPSMVILASFGLEKAGKVASDLLPQIARASQLSVAAFLALIALQASMLNFGYETSAQVSGNYLRSLAADLSAHPSEDSLVLIDPGGGRGDTLNAVLALPDETEVFFLSKSRADWAEQVEGFSDALSGRQQVWISFSITRGQFGVDKAGLYADFVEVLEAKGFTRGDVGSSDRANFHAVWTRS